MSAWDDASGRHGNSDSALDPRERTKALTEAIAGHPIYPVHREGLATVIDTEASKEVDGTRVAMSIRIVSITPEDMEWFDEHAPGWQEHMSVREVGIVRYVTNERLIRGPMNVVQQVTKELSQQVAKALVEGYEPRLEIGPPDPDPESC